MPTVRRPRRAPTRKKDPLDEYSTWDVRVARTFYYATILATAIIFLGIWFSIIAYAIQSGGLLAFFSLDPALIAAAIGGLITLHVLILVIFYTLFRGGIYRLCNVLFPDRKIAKKYEDYNVLRLLIAVLILGIYFTVTAFIIFLLPPEFWTWVWQVWIDIAINFTFGIWIIWLGVTILIIIIFFLIAFVLWSHGVFEVLKRVKRIEEEMEIDEEIKDQEVKGMSEEELHKKYHKETGKNATYRGKETKSYNAWKKDKSI